MSAPFAPAGNVVDDNIGTPLCEEDCNAGSNASTLIVNAFEYASLREFVGLPRGTGDNGRFSLQGDAGEIVHYGVRVSSMFFEFEIHGKSSRATVTI